MNADLHIRLVRDEAELDAAIRVRVRVFVEEQGGPPEDEPDEWDRRAEQFLVIAGGEVVGTARVYEETPGEARIGRVALLTEYRGRGWGACLMRALLEHCRARGFAEAELHAQTYAAPFYERFGFHPVGEEFIEAGIMHRRMRLPLRAPSPSHAP
jgi:predicted GNAT family N-acyltransferase